MIPAQGCTRARARSAPHDLAIGWRGQSQTACVCQKCVFGHLGRRVGYSEVAFLDFQFPSCPSSTQNSRKHFTMLRRLHIDRNASDTFCTPHASVLDFVKPSARTDRYGVLLCGFYKVVRPALAYCVCFSLASSQRKTERLSTRIAVPDATMLMRTVSPVVKS